MLRRGRWHPVAVDLVELGSRVTSPAPRAAKDMARSSEDVVGAPGGEEPGHRGQADPNSRPYAHGGFE